MGLPPPITESSFSKGYIGTKSHKSKGGKPRSLHNGKRVGKHATTTSVRGPVTNIGDRARTKLRYVDINSISLAGLNYGEKIYRLNSCFDPDFSGAGAQPLGFDQWAAFYTRYRVLSAKWKVQFAAATSLTESCVACIPNLVNTIDNVDSNVLAEPYAKSTLFSTNGGWKPVIDGEISIAKLFGLTPSEMSEENYTALTSASPVNMCYLHVRASTLSSGLSGTCYFKLEMEYDVEFYGRVELELSLWDDFVKFRKDKENKATPEKVLPPPDPPKVVSIDREVKELLDRIRNK